VPRSDSAPGHCVPFGTPLDLKSKSSIIRHVSAQDMYDHEMIRHELEWYKIIYMKNQYTEHHHIKMVFTG